MKLCSHKNCNTLFEPSSNHGYIFYHSCIFNFQVILCIRKGNLNEAWKHAIAAKKLSALAIIYGILFIVVGIAIYFLISVEVTHTLQLFSKHFILFLKYFFCASCLTVWILKICGYFKLTNFKDNKRKICKNMKGNIWKIEVSKLYI